MRGQYLVAVDLEGIHGVVGTPYEGLVFGSQEYEKAVENAIDEVNAVVKGLFEGGANLVAVWDNHGGGGNLDFSKIESRVIKITPSPMKKYERLLFAKNFAFDGILYVGYHSKEGSLNGVLAHSYYSKAVQYYKVNGIAVGELDIDSWAAAEYGIPPLFCASDAVGVQQAMAINENMQTVVTKYGTGRNTATLCDKQEVLTEMYQKAFHCVGMPVTPKKLNFPAELEIRYTRSEDAVKNMEKARSYGQIVDFGEDSHIIKTEVRSFADIETFL